MRTTPTTASVPQADTLSAYGDRYGRELAAFLDDAIRADWRCLRASRREGATAQAAVAERELRALLVLRRRAIDAARRVCNLCGRAGTRDLDPHSGNHDTCQTYERFRADLY